MVGAESPGAQVNHDVVEVPIAALDHTTPFVSAYMEAKAASVETVCVWPVARVHAVSVPEVASAERVMA
jgi:hypothetical protein